MNYLLYGIEDTLINNKIKDILIENKIDEISITKYDSTIDNLKNILDDCQTISLFNDKKTIIIDNSIYFSKGKGNEKDINLIIEYLNNSNPDTILIFISRTESIDNTKKITKSLKEHGHILELNKNDLGKIISELTKGYKISNKEITLLINRVGNDVDILSKEIEKIKCYTSDKLNITEEDIIESTSMNIDTDIFKFIDNIISKNKEEALTTYYELLKNNEEPIKIIGLLASKFRLMYQVKYLADKNLKSQEIATKLDAKKYPVELALKAGMRYSSTTLLKYLKALANLDLDMKTGVVDPKLGLELFILKV